MKSTAAKEPTIVAAYARVYAFLQGYKSRVADILVARNWDHETRDDVIALMAKLPKHEKVNEADAICIFEEIRTGNLEWSFPLDFQGERLGVFAARSLKECGISVNAAIPSCRDKAYWKHIHLRQRHH